MSESGLSMSRRIRRSPYTDKVEQHGVSGFSVVNHMLLPKAFASTIDEDYWHLRKHVQIWDVACQRQVEINGHDAASLVQLLTPRDLRNIRVGRCFYLPMIDETAGMLNDPVLLKLAEDHFWLSIADLDILLWVKGLAIGMGLNVRVVEPDVSPLAVQGPKSSALMAEIFGDRIHDLSHFGFEIFDLFGTRQLIARSGYSKQGGFEIYLNGGHLGGDLWDLVWNAGQRYNIMPGCPNLIERIEGGLMSYGNEFTSKNNPIECGFGPLCYLGDEIDYIGKESLMKIAEDGPKQKLCGIKFGGEATSACTKPYKLISQDGHLIGNITSGIYSPRLKCNVGVGMIAIKHAKIGQKISVVVDEGQFREGVVSKTPFEI